MKMKRIAVLATYVGKINRGAETFVIELCKHLRKKYIVDIYAAGMVEELKENTLKYSAEVLNASDNIARIIYNKMKNREKSRKLPKGEEFSNESSKIRMDARAASQLLAIEHKSFSQWSNSIFIFKKV